MVDPRPVRVGRRDGVRRGGGALSHAPLPWAVRGAPAPRPYAQPRDLAQRKGLEKAAGERRGEQVKKKNRRINYILVCVCAGTVHG